MTEIDSTNYFAMNLAMKPDTEEFTVVWADEQTSGRGEGNNFWESEAGKNLTFSIILKPCFLKIEQQFFLSKAISLAIANFLQPIAGHISVKWPNDIYWKNKKICGILIENIVEQNIIRNSIAGIGLNINQEKFLSNAPNPVSLKNIMKQDYDLEFCLKEILLQIERFYQLL
ncbi:MAG: biotin--[acetyl-CoA-carboxylase] ligase, partial [Bacteroidota bacterium]|nr:biotin--[acetyl-CoA-carboxylase] ligase [Bacteroidota bacterium]